MSKNPTIAILDENVENVNALAKLLCADYRIMLVKRTDELLKLLSADRGIVAVVVEALGSGENVAEVIKSMSNAGSGDIPVLVSSERSEILSAASAMEAGAFDALLRPYVEKIVKSRIDNALLVADSDSGCDFEIDQLTGIYNREAFCKYAAEYLQRNFDRRHVLLCFDINKFKVINDVFGNVVGDNILKRIASIISTRMNGIGICGRLEADHFVACYPYESFDINRVLTDIDGCFSEVKNRYDATVYVGIYLIDDITVSVDLMCDRANLALDTVKGSYVKRYAFYDDVLRAKLLEEQEIVNDMNEALLSGQFSIYLQPIYSVTTGLPIAAEALVRWKHPQKGIIPPNVFIPLFERNGFITKMDEYIWEQAVKYVSSRLKAGQNVVPVSVNVSRMDLYNQNIAEDILALTRKYDLPPQYLKIEITESAYMDNAQMLLDTVMKFQEKGFPVLMDDFGSGFSSLNMLKDVPVDILKIDMRFIDEVETSGRAGNVFSSIVRMARWLNIKVIAEGVEMQDQADFLKSIGCDLMQGYYFAKPMPIEEFNQLMDVKGSGERFARTENNGIMKDFDTLLTSSWDSNLLFNGLIGALGVYEFEDDTLEVVRVNDGYYEIMGSSPNSVFTDGKYALKFVADSDRILLLDGCRRAIKTGTVNEVLVRRYHQSGALKWLNVKLRYIGMKGKKAVLMFAIDDVTGRKQIEHEQEVNKYTKTLLSVYDEVIEVDFEKNISGFIFSRYCANCEDRSSGDLVLSLSTWINTYVAKEDRIAVMNFYNDDYLESQVMSGNEIPCIEFRIRTKDGIEYWCRSSMILVERSCYLCCNSDVTREMNAGHIMAENAVLQAEKRAEERYKIIVEQTETVVIEWDKETDGFFASDGFSQYAMSEIPESVLLANKSLAKVVHPDDRTLLTDFFEQTTSGSGTSTCELRLLMKDGSYRWTRMSATVKSDASGNVTRIIGTLNDISLMKAQESQLEERNAALLQMLNSLPAGIGIYNVDAEPIMLYLNNNTRRMFAIESDEPLSDINGRLSDFEVLNFGRVVDSDKIENKISETVVRARRSNGTRFWLKTYSCIKRDINNRLLCYAVFLDVTHQMETERALSRQNEFARMLTEVSEMMLFDYDAETDVMNYTVRMPGGKRIERRINKYSSYIEGESMVIHPAYKDAFGKMIVSAEDGDDSGQLEFQADFIGNGYRWYRAYYNRLREDGKVYRVIGRGEDIQLDKHTAERLSFETELRNAVLSHTLFVYEFSPNDSGATLLHSSDEMIEKFYPCDRYLLREKNSEYIHPDDVAKMSGKAETDFINGTLAHGSEVKLQYRILSLAGEWVWVENTRHLMRNSVTGELKGLGYVEVIEEKKALEMRAQIDSVSGLFNRATAETETERVLEDVGYRHGFFLYDIDNFKNINDTFGHTEGDKLLEKVGEVFREQFASSDIIGRIGGDEFMVLVTDIDLYGTDLNVKAMETLAAIARIPVAFGWDVDITVSLGISIAPKDGKTFAALYEAADKALYEAKAKGKNRAIIYSGS